MNLIVKDKKGEIIYFVKDCEARGNDYIGSNMRLLGVRPDAYALIWTDDEIAAIETVKPLTRGRSIKAMRFEEKIVAEAPAPQSWKETMTGHVNKATSIGELKNLMLEIIGRL